MGEVEVKEEVDEMTRDEQETAAPEVAAETGARVRRTVFPSTSANRHDPGLGTQNPRIGGQITTCVLHQL